MSWPPTTRRGLLGYGGAVFAGTLAGCLGEDRSGPELGNPEPYAEVGMTGENRFEPAIVHVVEGGTVEWVVEEGTHDTTAYHPDTHGPQRRIPSGAEPWESDRLSGEESHDRAFEEEGVYDYACTTHEDEGMVGTVVVAWPHPDEEPAIDPPAGEYPPAAADALETVTDSVREMLEEEHGEE